MSSLKQNGQGFLLFDFLASLSLKQTMSRTKKTAKEEGQSAVANGLAFYQSLQVAN
jgi:hypothetical protein